MIRLLAAAAFVILNVLAAAVFISDRRRVICGEPKASRGCMVTASAAGPFGALAAVHRTGCRIGGNCFILIYAMMIVHTVLLVLIFLY